MLSRVRRLPDEGPHKALSLPRYTWRTIRITRGCLCDLKYAGGVPRPAAAGLGMTNREDSILVPILVTP